MPAAPAQAMNDVMSGRVQLVLDAYAGLAAAIKGDLIKGLADTALERLPGFENLPTIAETVPDFFVGAWAVLVAPLGTPDAIIRKVNADCGPRSTIPTSRPSTRPTARSCAT